MFIKTKNKILPNGLTLIILLFSFFVVTNNTYAAVAKLNPANGVYQVGDNINIDVVIDSDIPVNAIKAKISYPIDILTLTSVSKNKSAIGVWAQEPLYSNVEGAINFEGVILYGFTGDNGQILSLVFKAKKVGVANIKFNTSSILAHDGNGTEVISGKINSSLTIIKDDKNTPLVEQDIAVGSTNILIKEINDGDNYSRNKFFIKADKTVKDNLYSIQIDSMNPIMWIDDGTNIFETPLLNEGSHTIRIIASDLSLNLLSGSLEFSTKVLKIPSITYYTPVVKVGDPIIIRGTADPYIDVEFNSINKETNESMLGHAQANIDGKFTYIPENENKGGTYTITARAIARNGVKSNYMNPIEILVKESFFKVLISKLIRLMILLIPYLLLLIIFILLLMYAIYRIKKYQIYLKKKLKEKEEIINQKFIKLEEETTEEERINIKEAEDVIEIGMKDLEKDVDNL